MKKYIIIGILLHCYLEAFSPQSKAIPMSPPSPIELEVKRVAHAIMLLETGGDSTLVGKSGERGIYQFMPRTWRRWSREVGVEEMTVPNQKKVAEHKIRRWVEAGYTPQQIASMWNSGSPNWKNRKGVNRFGVKFDTEKYVEKFNLKYYTYETNSRNLAGK